MWIITRHQILEGLNDARFIFASLIVLVAFMLNGFVYSDKVHDERENWQRIVNTNEAAIREEAEDLQDVADLTQPMTKPYSVLAFIADDGPIPLVNTLTVDAFTLGHLERNNPINEQMPFLPAFDWVFIITTFMTILCILLAYGAICEEKVTGTLRQILSHPVSRMQLFFGKFLGLLVTITLVQTIGMLISLLILALNNALVFSTPVLLGILWAYVLSVLLLSLFILISMFVSSMTSQPRVSLIILLVIWVILIVIIPGAANLLGETFVEIPSQAAVQRELNESLREVRANHPDDAGSWNGDMTADFMPRRMRMYEDMRAARQSAVRQLLNLKIQQVKAINTLSWMSPTGLFRTFLQEVSNTGVNGFETLLNNAVQYTNTFEDYVRQTDATDDDSPHMVYHTGTRVEPGTFSTKPVDPSTIPRWTNLWQRGGLPREERWPAMQLLLLLIGSLQMGLLAFWGFYRYDPR